MFINKRNRKKSKKGHQFVKSFIRNCWNKELRRYINLDYGAFKSNKAFKSLLLIEQGFLCCYCMRYLSNADMANLEHIIPQSCLSKEECKDYFKHGVKRNIILWNEDRTKKLRTPPYPHFIAYENLVASCKSNDHCNHKRGKDKIIPIFFLNNASSIIQYEKDGELTYSEEYKDTVKAINLNYLTLKRMREAWAKVCTECSLHEITSATGERRKDIIAIFSSDLRSYIEKNWELFLQYRWFYSYFHTRQS